MTRGGRGVINSKKMGRSRLWMSPKLKCKNLIHVHNINCKYSYDTSTAEHLSLYPWRLSVSLYSMCICSVMVLRTTLQVFPLPKYNFSLSTVPIIAKVFAHWADRSFRVFLVDLPIQVLSLSVSFSTKINFYENSSNCLFSFWLWFWNLDIHSLC